MPAIPFSFSHAAMLAQLFGGADATLESLKRSGHYEGEKEELFLQRIQHAKNWAEKYAPEGVKICLLTNLKEVEGRLNAGQKQLLTQLSDWLSDTEATAEEIQNKIYALAKANEVPLKAAFEAVYLFILGKERGPKAGTLIASLDREWVVSRFREAGNA